jgi:hypothetical protein
VEKGYFFDNYYNKKMKGDLTSLTIGSGNFKFKFFKNWLPKKYYSSIFSERMDSG